MSIPDARNRTTYLQRPDLGRKLATHCEDELSRLNSPGCDLSIIISDGLSATAVHSQTIPLLDSLLPRLNSHRWRLSPIIVARFGRVALQDPIGNLVKAKIALILIGERPGLGSPDSLGAYMVFNPKPGNTDANRNCVSNIRPDGLNFEAAAETLYYLLTRSRQLQISGVGLKDERQVLEHQTDSSAPQIDFD